MFQSSFAKQFVEADILLFIEPERILVTRCSGLPVGYVCQFSVGVHNIVKKAFDSGECPASQSEHLCRTNANLSDKGTARYPLARVRIRGGKIFEKTLPNLRYGFRGKVFPLCNITTVGRRKKARRTDWSGQWRTSESRYFSRLYLTT